MIVGLDYGSVYRHHLVLLAQRVMSMPVPWHFIYCVDKDFGLSLLNFKDKNFFSVNLCYYQDDIAFCCKKLRRSLDGCRLTGRAFFATSKF